MHDDDTTTLGRVLERLAQLEAANAALQDELHALKERHLPPRVLRPDAVVPSSRADEAIDRRSLLRGAGAAAAIGAGLLVAGSALEARPAAAAEGGHNQGSLGDPLLMGYRNSFGPPGHATKLVVNTADDFAFGAQNGSGKLGNGHIGLYGDSGSATNGRGVHGHAFPGPGNFGIHGSIGVYTGLAGQTAGVCGDSRSSMGVVGLSTYATSVFGLNNGSGIAVFGYQTGTERAVLGRVDQTGSRAPAVHGTTNGDGVGVLGEITKPTSGAHAVHGLTQSTSGNAVFGEVTNTGSTANAVLGIAKGSGNAVYGHKPPGAPGDAVVGWSRTGNGAFGLSDDGIGVKAQGGRAALLLAPIGRAGPPGGSTHEQGEVAADAKGVLWICTKGAARGDGGTPTWRQALTSGVNQLDGGSATLTSNADGATLTVANNGQFAQARLVPSPVERPPKGQAGDLFVDKSKDLWFCKGGRNWVQVA